MRRRLRSLSVLTILVGGALALISSTQTWVDVALRGTSTTLAVPGATALPLLAPLSLAALALGLALSIVGRALRYVFGALGVAIGVSLCVGALRILIQQPVEAVAGAVTDATGLAGTETVRGLVSTLALSPWPVVTVLAALAIAAGGVATLATAHRWPGAGRRYRTDAAETAAGSRPHDAIDSWDDLSRGDDPTA